MNPETRKGGKSKPNDVSLDRKHRATRVMILPEESWVGPSRNSTRIGDGFLHILRFRPGFLGYIFPPDLLDVKNVSQSFPS